LLTDIEKVRNQAADKLGVNSTPTFFINGKIERGALSTEEMGKKIDAYLKG
jgi:protein-disulfide isomerase